MLLLLSQVLHSNSVASHFVHILKIFRLLHSGEADDSELEHHEEEEMNNNELNSSWPSPFIIPW